MKQVGTNNSQVESPTVSRTIGHTSPTVFDYVSPRDMTKFDSKDRILQSIKREKSSLSPTNSSGRNSSNPSPFRPAPASPPPPPPPLASPPYGKNAKILETTAETHVKPVVVGIVPNGQETDNQQTPVKSILRHFELRVEQPVAQRSSGTNPSEIRPTKRISQLKSPTELSSPVVIKMSDKTAEKPSLQKVSEIRKNFLSPTEDLPDLIRPTNGVIKAEEKLNVDSLTPVISSDYVVDSGKLLSSNRYEVTTDYSDKRTSDNHSVISDSSACREWDPSRLLEHLYRIEYQPKAEEIRPNFIDMEGTIEHLPIGMKSMGISKAWKTHYFRTNEGRLEWFEVLNIQLIKKRPLRMNRKMKVVAREFECFEASNLI